MSLIYVYWTIKYNAITYYSIDCHLLSEDFVPFELQWTPVTTTAFVPKGVAIKMNLLLYRILNEQIDNYVR